MILRPAGIDDSEMLFNWANDSEVREMAFSQEKLIWESHDAWYRGKLKDPNTKIYVLVDNNNTALGQIRFDIEGEDKAVVDVHTKTGLRGKGTGKLIISMGTDKYFEDTNINLVHATIKQDNIKSVKAFTKADYILSHNVEISGVACCEMVRTRKLSNDQFLTEDTP